MCPRIGRHVVLLWPGTRQQLLAGETGEPRRPTVDAGEEDLRFLRRWNRLSERRCCRAHSPTHHPCRKHSRPHSHPCWRRKLRCPPGSGRAELRARLAPERPAGWPLPTNDPAGDHPRTGYVFLSNKTLFTTGLAPGYVDTNHYLIHPPSQEVLCIPVTTPSTPLVVILPMTNLHYFRQFLC